MHTRNEYFHLNTAFHFNTIFRVRGLTELILDSFIKIGFIFNSVRNKSTLQIFNKITKYRIAFKYSGLSGESWVHYSWRPLLRVCQCSHSPEAGAGNATQSDSCCWESCSQPILSTWGKDPWKQCSDQYPQGINKSLGGLSGLGCFYHMWYLKFSLYQKFLNHTIKFRDK